MNVHEYLGELALDLATRAASLAEERRRQGVEVAETKSSSVDIVTAVDQDVELFLRREVDRMRPDDGFVGEEGEDTPSQSGVSWIVDPIDGTVNFLYGIPRSAVSIGVRDGDEIVVGAVVNIMTDDRYYAVRGSGAFLNGKPVRVRDVPPMDQRLVHTGFGYRSEVRARQGQAVARMLPRVRDIRRQGSAALDLCDIACGRADAYLEEGLNLWDYAAAGLIAEEAGARLYLGAGAGGATFVLAAPEGSFAEMVALAEECGFLADGGEMGAVGPHR
jgi:myo-inositol-1(or 4)-monophosphatase